MEYSMMEFFAHYLFLARLNNYRREKNMIILMITCLAKNGKGFLRLFPESWKILKIYLATSN
jgi:hypothetical protein